MKAKYKNQCALEESVGKERYVLKISFQLFLVDFGVDLGARPQGHSELWPKGLSPKMPKSNKNNGR